VDLLENYKVDGLPDDMANTTKQIVVAKVRCFLRTAFRRGWIEKALARRNDDAALARIRAEVAELANQFPLYAWLR